MRDLSNACLFMNPTKKLSLQYSLACRVCALHFQHAMMTF
jgi:hypothetical protein